MEGLSGSVHAEHVRSLGPMVRPRDKGTIAETAVVGFLRDNGWPYAERRALHGAMDKGDVTGIPGLAMEVKWANAGMKIGPWLTETGIERLNAAAEHGVLVVKPLGLGVTRVESWYAVMVQEDFLRLKTLVDAALLVSFHTNGPLAPIVLDGPVTHYTAATLRWSLNVTALGKLAPAEVLVLTLRPPGTKDRPDAWYRVTTLGQMVRLLHAAGYGSSPTP